MKTALLKSVKILALAGVFIFLVSPLACRGESPKTSLEINIPGKGGLFPLGDQGELKTSVLINSDDDRLSFSVPAGTVITDKDGGPVQRLKIEPDPTTLPPPESARLISPVYDCQPNGATLTYPARLTLAFDSAKIPVGVLFDDIYLAAYEAGQWQALPYKKVDPAKPLASTQVDYLGKYAVVAPLKSAAGAASAAPGVVASANISISEPVYATANRNPFIETLEADPTLVAPYEKSTLKCVATDPDGDKLTYKWSATEGGFEGEGASVMWVAPSQCSTYTITVQVDDGRGGKAKQEIEVRVKNPDG